MLKNINKNLIIIGLGAILVLVLSALVFPATSHAEYAYYHFSRPNPNAQLYPDPTPEVIYQDRPVVIYRDVPVYEDRTSTNYTNTTSNSTSTNKVSSTTNSTNTNSTATNSKVTSANYKNLTASAIFGSKSFMPSGLVQWIILAIFILLIIILARKALGAEDRYHSEPLKHA